MQNYIAGDPTIKAAYMAKGQKKTAEYGWNGKIRLETAVEI